MRPRRRIDATLQTQGTTRPRAGRPARKTTSWTAGLALAGLAAWSLLSGNAVAQSGSFDASLGMSEFGKSSQEAPRLKAFQPDLGMAPELIDGGKLVDAKIPVGAAELMAHPIQTESLQPLVASIPGYPIRPINPLPRVHAWWKYPVYAAVGLPRDLADGFFGLWSYVPAINVLDYAVYELVPTQAFLRDPRDWHYWTANRNKKGHGFYDGNAWGYFPSLNSWTFSWPSPEKAAALEASNDEARRRLKERNRQIEQRNHVITARKLDARQAALRAIEQGDGAEAVRRMAPYVLAYPLDADGSFALLATGLALYAPEGPAWTAPMLWKRLSDSQPATLAQAQDLMTTASAKAKSAPILDEARIYVALLRGQADAAQAVAQERLKQNPDNPRLKRLALETALTAHDANAARAAFGAMDLEQLPALDREMTIARMELFEGQIDQARRRLAQLQAAAPENACLNYYLGCAELAKLEQSPAGANGFAVTFARLEQAVQQASHPALRQRAGEALAYARSLLATTAGAPAPAESSKGLPGLGSGKTPFNMGGDGGFAPKRKK